MSDTVGIQDRRRPFTMIDDLIILDTDLSMKAKMTYVVLAQHTGKEGICWPSVSRIAKLAGTSPTSIKRGLKELVDANYIKYERRTREDGGKTSNLYILIDLHNHPKNKQIFPIDHNDPSPQTIMDHPIGHNDPRTILNRIRFIKNNNTESPVDNSEEQQPTPDLQQNPQNVVVVQSLNDKFKTITSHDDPDFIAGLLAFYKTEDIEKQLKNMETYSKHNKLDNPQGFLLAALKGNWSVPQTDTQKADQQSDELLQQIKTWKEEATSQEAALEYLQSMRKNQRGN